MQPNLHEFQPLLKGIPIPVWVLEGTRVLLANPEAEAFLAETGIPGSGERVIWRNRWWQVQAVQWTEQVRLLSLVPVLEQEERLAELVGVAYWDWHLPSDRLIWNAQVYRLLGLDPQTTPPCCQVWQERVHPADRERVRAFCRSDQGGEMEYRIIRSNGEVHWIWARSQVLRDQQGQPYRRLGILVDLTDKYSNLGMEAENLSGAVCSYIQFPDGGDAMLSMSSGCRQLWGLDPAVVIEDCSHLWNVVHPEDVPLLRASLQESAQALTVWDQRWRITTPAGEQKWLHARGKPQRLTSGATLWHCFVLDVTERQQQWLETQTQQQLFRSLAEHSPDGICRMDRQGRYLYVNPAICQMLGMPAAMFLGRTNRELGLPPEVVERCQEGRDIALATGRLYSQEMTVVTGTGERRQILYSVVPERGPDGEITSFLITERDITPLKQAQRSLEQQIERERLLNQVIRSIRQSLDWQEIITIAVQEIRRILQTSRAIIYRFDENNISRIVAESVEDPWIPAVSWAETISYPEAWLAQLRAGKNLICNNCSCLELKSDPQSIQRLNYLEIKAKLGIPIFTGQVLWGVLALHHCTQPHDWHQWEINCLETLAEQLGVAIQQSQLYERIRYLNAHLQSQVEEQTAALQQSLRFDRLLREITAKIRDTLDEKQVLATVVRELGTSLNLLCCDTGIYDPSGTYSIITHEFSALENSHPHRTYSLTDDAGIHFWLRRGYPTQFCMITPGSRTYRGKFLATLACPIRDHEKVLGDIWLFRECEQTFSAAEVALVEQVANQCGIALRQSRLFQAAQNQVALLERLNRLKDDFLSTVSHELRTPMSNITMALEMIQNRLKNLRIEDSLLQRYCQVLRTESKREINLINDLLELTQLDANTTPINVIPLDTSSYVKQLIAPFQAEATGAGITFEAIWNDPLPSLTTDPNHLSRILEELLTNACKYTPPGNLIRLRVCHDRENIFVYVFNSGVTIPQEEHQRIFDRFYRIPNRDPWKYPGTGLGLSLVKKLVELLGGQIWLRTGPAWVEFGVQLPLSPA